MNHMLAFLLLTLIVLWFLGYVHLGGIVVPDMILFSINGQPITLWSVLILIVVAWAIGILATPFREIAGILLVLWVLSVLGILVISGLALSNLLVIAIIVGMVFSLASTIFETHSPRTQLR